MTAYILNLFDLVCTILALRLGAQELNPLMAHIPVLIVYKLFAVGLLLSWLSRRREKLAHTGLHLCTAVYAALALYHLICLFWIGGIIWSQ